MTTEKHIIIYLYYSIRDPLCEGLMLGYLKDIKIPGVVYHIVTYEQEKYQMSAFEQQQLQEELLNKYNIHWHPIPYLSGSFFIFKKLISAFRAIHLVQKIKRSFNVKLVCAMATPVGTYAFIASRLYGIPMCQFTYEPHALIMMQSGRISPTAFKYKIARWMEIRIGKNAEYVVCTTRHMLNDLQMMHAKGKIYRLPTSVDENTNQYRASARESIRKKFQLDNKTVLIYPGKFGGMYRAESTIELIASFLRKAPNGHAVIITDYDLQEIRNWMKIFQIQENRVTLLPPVSLQELPDWLSTADVGLIAYENFDARKYCSPVKTGEYLMCGLPIIVQRGTSEDDEIVEDNRLGVVLKTYDDSGLSEKWEELDNILTSDKTNLRNRCREVGLSYRGKKNAVALLTEIFSTI